MTSQPASDDTSNANEKIEVLYDAENIVNRTLQDLVKLKASFDNCTDHTGPSVFLAYQPMWNACIAANVKEGDVPTQLIRSNVRAFVEQQQYFFETLWTKATPAEQRIREIEEGIIHVKSKIVEDENEIIKEIRCLNNAARRLSVCSTFGGMQMSYNYFFDTYKKNSTT